MIGYYTRFTTKPEDRVKLASMLTKAAEVIRTVDGCKFYGVSADTGDSAITSVNEIWTDEQAHDASLKLDEAKALIAQAIPLLTDKPKQAKLGPVITSWI